MDLALPAAFPVIHPVSAEAAGRSIRTAVDAGADGIFLINQGGMNAEQVLKLAQTVANRFPKLPVGVNILGRAPGNTMWSLKKHFVRMLWSDGAPIGSVSERSDWEKDRHLSDWHGPFFGGVAFKYADPVADAQIPDLLERARRLPPIVDVVTTSGDETGMPPTLDKVRLFRRHLGPHAPLALASGMTPENVGSYIEAGADAFLVATGIESSFGTLDPKKTKAFVDAVRAQPRSGRIVLIPEGAD